MKGLSLLVLLAVGAFAAVHAEEVVTLTGKNFDEIVYSADFIVVEFYAPWCGHCKKLAPEYEKAAEALKKSGSTAVLAKMDATEDDNKAVAGKFGVKGYPTLKIFRKGSKEPADYQGPREADGIVNYVNKASGPPSVLISTAEEAKMAVDKADVVVVGVVDAIDSAFHTTFNKVASALVEEFNFHHTTDGSILPTAAPSSPAVYVYKKFDEGIATFDGALEVDKIVEFIKKKAVPLVSELNKENRDGLRRLFTLPLPKVISFIDYKKTPEAETAIRAALTEAAKETEEMVMVMGDVTDNEGALKFFGIEEDALPALVIHDSSNDKKYVTPKVEAADIATKLAAFKSGELKASIKSEDVPASNDGPVYTLVASEFEEKVFGEKKDVLIEFYAPWCGHCKKLAPIYEEVGEAFKADSNVVIAKMDATANDIPGSGFNVKGFPTLYFVKGSTGEIMSYSGDRSKDDMIKYVKKNGSGGGSHDEL
jgi:protein disulfide-isomerase A1